MATIKMLKPESASTAIRLARNVKVPVQVNAHLVPTIFIFKTGLAPPLAQAVSLRIRPPINVTHAMRIA